VGGGIEPVGEELHNPRAAEFSGGQRDAVHDE